MLMEIYERLGWANTCDRLQISGASLSYITHGKRNIGTHLGLEIERAYKELKRSKK